FQKSAPEVFAVHLKVVYPGVERIFEGPVIDLECATTVFHDRSQVRLEIGIRISQPPVLFDGCQEVITSSGNGSFVLVVLASAIRLVGDASQVRRKLHDLIRGQQKKSALSPQVSREQPKF